MESIVSFMLFLLIIILKKELFYLRTDINFRKEKLIMKDADIKETIYSTFLFGILCQYQLQFITKEIENLVNRETV